MQGPLNKESRRPCFIEEAGPEGVDQEQQSSPNLFDKLLPWSNYKCPEVAKIIYGPGAGGTIGAVDVPDVPVGPGSWPKIVWSNRVAA